MKHRGRAFLLSVCNALIVSIPYFFAWRLYYARRIADYFHFWGQVLICFLFFILFFLLANLYSGFAYRNNHAPDLVYSQLLAVTLDNFVIYIVIWLLSKELRNVLPLFASFVAECILIRILCYGIKAFVGEDTGERDGTEDEALPEGDPLISVIMPAYNSAAYLPYAIRSVLSQTYRNLELIVVDDASADDTEAILASFSDPRLCVIRNEKNIGVGAARNRGVAAASGNWIAFLDADDTWKPDKLEKQMHLLLHHPDAALLYTGSRFTDAEGRRVDYVLRVPAQVNRSQLLKQNILSCSSALVRKEYMEKYPMPDRRDLHEDFAVWIRILSEVPYAYGVDEPLLYYRLSKTSKSGNKLRAIRMTWNTYTYCGVTGPEKAWSMLHYLIRNSQKYATIRSRGLFVR